jgi:hypothetical protein
LRNISQKHPVKADRNAVISTRVETGEFLWYILFTNEEPCRHGYSELGCI